jgi:hypothetical protein
MRSVPTRTSTRVIPMMVDIDEIVFADVLKGDLFMR